MTRTFRRQLLASSLLVGASVALASPAFAQDAPPGSPQDQNAQGVTTPDSVDIGEEGADIVVTGSLIRNPNLEQSSPVASIGQEEILLRQANVAENFLRELPGIVPSIGSAVNNGNGGSSFVDLRGLGFNRNLVLLDGTRIVPAGLAGATDLNNIPLALVERTDILTGGASTTYGADAVSGVVNFITRQDFSGVEISANQQITEVGDGNQFRFDLTVGGNFADDRGNAVFSIGYQESDPVFQGDRDFSRNNIDSFTGVVGGGSGTAVPGRFSVPGSGTLQINPATGALVPTFQLFNFNPQNIFQTPFERFNMYGAARFEVADGIEVYNQGIFSRNSVSTVIASSGTFGNSLTIPLSNPYLPAGARNQFCTAGVDADLATAGRQTPTAAQCDAFAAATDPTSPNFRTFTTNASRRFVEAGPRLAEYQTTLFNYRMGARGDITDSFRFDVFGSYGESENTQRQSGNGTLTRLRQAANATTTTTCIDSTNACVPINLFGEAGSITPDQLGFLLGVTNSTTTRTTLSTARGFVEGDFGVTSPFATQGVNIAVGAEYRRYTAAVISDALTQTPNEVLGNGAASPDVRGEYDVYEGFGELLVPLIEDRPFFKSLTLELGARYSKYSTAGGAFTYKAGGSWEPFDSLKFRGNYQRATRSPNIGELFAPLVTGLDNGTDPCAGAAPNGSAALRDVCVAQIIAGGGTAASAAGLIGTIDQPSAGQVNVTGGGNPNLDVEKATTYTIGGVFQPTFVPGLAVTVDYFNIKVKDAISSQTVGDAIIACFGQNPAAPPAGAAANPACTAISRDPLDGTLNGTADGYPQPLSNLGRIATDGIDLNVNYQRDFGNAGLVLNFQGTWTNSNRFNSNVNSPLSVNRECVSFYSINCGSIQPEFAFNQRTTLRFDGVDISLLWRFIDDVQYEPIQYADDVAAATNAAGVVNQSFVVNDEFLRIGAEHYFDLSARFELTDNFDVTATAINLLDNQPKIVGATVGTTDFNSGNIYPSTYDSLGRRFAVSARMKF
ncbi:MAG TPA: TonB-dependent receptor [Sphingomonas sp.]|jgi:outer membrane receptor protein involved in Fe transport|uniref:TonB-dependent receptor domain-containing protein n=1 Tax=Sphingomonas sp. TaxID=28214 RepID=UPI002ED88AA0